MPFQTRLDPSLVRIAEPTGTNALSIAGAGLNQFGQQQAEDEVRTLSMDEHRKKVQDDKALLDFNKHLDEGGSKRSWYEKGGTFSTASGANAADDMVSGRALEKMKQKKFALSVAAKKQQAQIREGRYGLAKRANASLVASRARKGSTAVADGAPTSFNADAFATSATEAPSAEKTSTPAKVVTVYGKDGKPLNITVKG